MLSNQVTILVLSASSFEPNMAFKIPLLDPQSYFRDVPNFRWADVTDKDEIGKGSFGSVIKAHYIPEKACLDNGLIRNDSGLYIRPSLAAN